jgi:hypothetical protein
MKKVSLPRFGTYSVLLSFLICLLLPDRVMFAQGASGFCGVSHEDTSPPSNTTPPQQVPQGIITLKLYIYILRTQDNNPASGAQDADVQQVLNQLNQDYAPSQIQFALSCVQPIANSSIYFDPTLVLTMGDNFHEDGLNLYLSTQSDGGLSGSATLGGKRAFTQFGGLFSHIPTHEVGHMLSLWHTFRGMACGPEANAGGTDEVDDTPSDWGNYPSPAEGCTTWTPLSPCSGQPRPNPGPNVLLNHMSYAADACKSLFTPGQTTRMRNHIIAQKQNMILNYSIFNTSQTISNQEILSDTDIIIKGSTNVVFSSCTIRMAANKKILVEPGATLQLTNNSIVTNWPSGNCSGESGLWTGIVLANSARVLMSSSTISNAYSAIYYLVVGGAEPNIVAKNCVFENNLSSIQFANANFISSYNLLSNNLRSNTFSYCTFIWTNGYAGSSFFDQIRLRGVVRKTVLKGCTILNNQQGLNDPQQNSQISGINSFDSKIFVLSENDQNGVSTFSTISGFYYGTRISSGFSPLYPHPAVIDKTFFTNNRVGIDFNTIRGASFTNSRINNYSDYYMESEGLFISRSTGYKIDNNEFVMPSGFDTAFPSVGVNFSAPPTGASSNESNLIANNRFEDQRLGIRVGGFFRSNNNDFDGLFILCNDNFRSRIYDYRIIGAIARNQGTPNKHAGNRFTDGSPSPQQVDYSNSGGDVINYFFIDDGGTSEPNPTIGVNLIEIPIDNPICDLPAEAPPGFDGSIEGLRIYFEGVKADYQADQSNYLSMIDNGDTPLWLDMVNEATLQNASTVKSALINLSPFVSNKVLSAVLDRYDIFTNQDRVDILRANPEVLKDGKFMQLVEGNYYPFTVGQINMLKQSRHQTTARGIMEANLGWKKLKKDKIINKALSIISEDSIVVDFAEMRIWLADLGSFEAQLGIASTYLYEGDYANWQQYVTVLSTSSLSGSERENLSTYVDFHQLLLNVLGSQRDFTQFDSTELNFAQLLATTNDDFVAKGIQNFLNAWYGIEFSGERALYQTGQDQEGNVKNVTNQAQLRVSVAPNPASSTIYFNFEKQNKETAQLEVFDSFGVRMISVSIPSGTLQFECPIGQLNSGFFYYRVSSQNGYSASGKFIVK